MYNSKYDKTYLEEVNINDVSDRLEKSLKRIDSLKNLHVKRGSVDNESKLRILSLCDEIDNIFDLECNKELSIQKLEGKEFLTDDDINKIFKE